MFASPSHAWESLRDSEVTRVKRDVFEGESMPPKKLSTTRMPMSVWGGDSRSSSQEARRSLVSRVLTRPSDSGSLYMMTFPNESSVSAKRDL